jgi:hypothetical protein
MYSYRTTLNWVLLVIACIFVVGGLVLMLIPGLVDGLEYGAGVVLLFLTLAICQYLTIKNKSITLIGDRIQMVTFSGRKATYSANQMTRFWWTNPDSKYGQYYVDLIFEDNFRFLVGNNIDGDYADLVENLKAIVPPTADKRESGVSAQGY